MYNQLKSLNREAGLEPLIPGDLIAVPTSDGVKRVAQFLSSVGHGFADGDQAVCPTVLALSTIPCLDEQTPKPLRWGDVVACLFVTDDQLSNGNWAKVKVPTGLARWNIWFSQKPTLRFGAQILQKANANDFVGVTVVGSAVVQHFLDACVGQYPWDGMHDPGFFDGLLLQGLSRPPAARLKSQMTHIQ